MFKHVSVRLAAAVSVTALLFLSGIAGTARADSDPALQGPATAAQAGQSLIVDGDMVLTGEGPLAMANPTLACTERNQYPQGDQVLFRVRVVDPVTQQPLDNTQIQSVTLTMPDGSTHALEYGGLNRGQSSDHAWKYVWKIPADYPTGTVNFQISAVDNQGRTGTYFRWDSPPSEPTIVPQSAS